MAAPGISIILHTECNPGVRDSSARITNARIALGVQEYCDPRGGHRRSLWIPSSHTGTLHLVIYYRHREGKDKEGEGPSAPPPCVVFLRVRGGNESNGSPPHNNSRIQNRVFLWYACPPGLASEMIRNVFRANTM